MSFPGGSDGKVSVCSEGDTGSIPSSISRKIPWRRKWQPTPVPLPGKFHGWRSLVGYSLWGCKEWGMTERLHFHFQPRIRKVARCHRVRKWQAVTQYQPLIHHPLSLLLGHSSLSSRKVIQISMTMFFLLLKYKEKISQTYSNTFIFLSQGLLLESNYVEST